MDKFYIVKISDGILEHETYLLLRIIYLNINILLINAIEMLANEKKLNLLVFIWNFR